MGVLYYQSPFCSAAEIVEDVASCPGSQPMHLNMSNGYISSPTAHNSDLYSNGLNCRWQIQVPDGKVGWIVFHATVYNSWYNANISTL